MDCGNSNRNAHYANRSGRNMSGGMNSGRNSCGNTMQRRDGCGGMNQTRNNYSNMNQRRNNENMNRSNNNCGCMRDMQKDECVGGCDRGTEHVDHMMPGMGFVPWQKWEDVYCIDDGLENGTIFGQLNKPYIGRSSK